MAPENRGHHVDPGEPAVLARAASDRLRPSGLHVATADTNGAAELLLQGTGCLRVGRPGCRLPGDAAPITYAGLEQLGKCSLIGVEQLIRPLQTIKPFGQRLYLLITRLDFLPAISSRSRFLYISTEFIVTMVPEGPPRGGYSASWLSLCSAS